ncbi:MAG TPA: alpha/beta hydrolase [Solirubrobacteraceae bacterium]|jgi:pimeloyl-ACP methyl ester carboxylesterase
MRSTVATTPANGLEIAYETFGSSSDPPILLIHGLATQMLGWPDPLCSDLADQSYYVVRFDNRDVGLSTHLTDAPPVDLQALLGGDHSSAPYRLSDMGRDTVGLIDGLGLDSAHLVGASMGGTIAQTVAIEHPERVRTLTSIMSTTGNPAVGQPSGAAMAALLAPPATDREGAIERTLQAYRVVGSPGFPFDEDGLRDRTGRAFDRAHDPPGVIRQLAAVAASGDRTERLRDVRVPTLVIHGREDPLAHVSGGEATAEAIPDAELVIYDGMGHDLPRALWPDLIDRIRRLCER